jgi:transposase-like protein
LPLAWALVPIENKEWWTWFCKNLCEAFDRVEEEGFVFISDREKGLIPAVEEIFPRAVHSHCCNHIADNIAADYGNKCKPLFWKCARAKTKEAFEIALRALSTHSREAGCYVDNIPHHAWARYAFPKPRFGHDTSNINESINNAWLDIRRLPPLQMLDEIYTTVMKTVCTRSISRTTEVFDYCRHSNA